MPNNYVLLETIALTQSAASVTFDNLPTSGYTDLKVVHSARMTNTDSPILLNFNGVTTGYSWRRLYGNGSSASSQSGTDAYFLHGNTSSMTANTFSNSEFYIPNYRSNQAKSISAESALETNATAGELFMHAVLWNNTAAITSFTMTPLTGSFVANSTFSLYGIAALGTTPVTAPKATGGNIVANDGTYWYHAFTSSGYFVPQTNLIADCLVIAGGGSGGAGGANVGGGGGAGGLLYSASNSLGITSFAVTVGAGGALANQTDGNNGSNSVFNSLTAIGGGGGAGTSISSGTARAGKSGGSGGGASYWNGGTASGGAATSGQGNKGGDITSSVNNNRAGAGGGGAGVAGANVVTNGFGTTGGNGLNTYSSWASATNTGVSGYYAGGGAGMGDSQAGSGQIAGGLGGGGGAQWVVNGVAGVANTGSGGGGSIDPSTVSGAGGSGIVIIRYPIA